MLKLPLLYFPLFTFHFPLKLVFINFCQILQANLFVGYSCLTRVKLEGLVRVINLSVL